MVLSVLFQNWMKNSLKISNTSLHEDVWNILSTDSDNVSRVVEEGCTVSVLLKKREVYLHISLFRHLCQASEVPQQPKENKQSADGVEVCTNVKNGQLNLEKKKMNKRERKEARKQNNGKKCTGNNVEEPEENQVVKKKKDRKRKHNGDEAGNVEQNGAVTKRSKTSKTFCDVLHWLLYLIPFTDP